MNEWEKLEETSVRVGFRKLLRRHYLLPNGKQEEFVVKDEPDSVCILALTPQQNVILAKQFRPGPEEILLELPGGVAEGGESLEQAAVRELMEETGYAGEMSYVGSQYNCAYSTRMTHSFVATQCTRIADIAPDENEFIEVVEMPMDMFKTHLRSGKLTDTKTGFFVLDALHLL